MDVSELIRFLLKTTSHDSWRGFYNTSALSTVSFIYLFYGIVKVLLLFHSHWSVVHAVSACGWRESLTGQLCRTVAQLWLHKIHQLNKQTAGPWRQQHPLGPAGSRFRQLLLKATLSGVDCLIRQEVKPDGLSQGLLTRQQQQSADCCHIRDS